ncbi:PAQR family membrane homeostasis protein TrhA [Aporhodopirellula aestuarii]|uniref:Hemolysin III family protein n=1 Tax=Aporhodopirellula aestuarii TaxID=2950107 RepID=A0ABT0U0L5_9BACT|nr:hemolysin III family protein [Aporhodopirellula aestuarii]MCM2370105.1 hemolysin III family protein [Aporhodopirellula aestuarii]
MSNETIENPVMMAPRRTVLPEVVDAVMPDHDSPPIQPEQEWANAWTHGIAAAAWIGLSAWMVIRASETNLALAIACAAYGASVVGTFTCSTLSHTFLERPLLDRFRAWDQAMIYLMIVGTYTPIMVRYAVTEYRDFLLVLMWGYAFWGFAKKAFLSHRIHSISTVSYLMLGWLPAIPLYGRIPMNLFLYVLAGGVTYSLGVLFLINDRRVKYMHAVWHLFVISASIFHFVGVVRYVIDAPL